MKLMVGRSKKQQGFALPTILLVSIVMLAVLISSIGAAAGSRVALDSQYYNELAHQAADAGIARATDCLKANGYQPQWTTAANSAALVPKTGCSGTGSTYSSYVLDTPTVRTLFSVDAPVGADIGSELTITGTAELLRSSLNILGTHDVWRRYDYTTYMRIEPPTTIACPDGFIPVPGNSLFGTSEFCVAKYETKEVNGNAVVQAAGTPYVNISQYEAEDAATAVCNGCHLITEAEWLTVAHNALNVNSNWSGGVPGSGYMYTGHNDAVPANTFLAASSNDTDGYNGTGNSGNNQRRTLRLSNGEIIWDLSGNAWEWTDGQITGQQPGKASVGGFGWNEFSAVDVPGYSSTPVAPLYSFFPSYGTSAASSWNFATQGIGKLYSNTVSSQTTGTYGFIRGGDREDTQGYGVLSLALSHLATSNGYPTVGFRVAVAPTQNLYANWSMNEASGSSISDSSGNSRTATATGTTIIAGKYSNSRSFNGTSSDYITAPAGFSDFTSGLTVAMWVYPTSTAFWSRFIDLGNGQGSNNILFARNASTNDLSFEVYNGAVSGGQVTATGALTLNTWQHIAVTESSTGNVILYKNGIQIGSGTTAVPNNITRNNNYLGRSNWGGDAYYAGRLDEARVYNRVLSPQEIASLQ